MSNPLPPPSPNQAYVTVSPLAAGWITLPDNFFIHPSTPGSKRTVPSLAFLITHPGDPAHASKPIRLMFDLGLRKSLPRYPEVLQQHIVNGRVPFRLEPGIAAQLRHGGVDPRDVQMVVLSHVHYDHHGDPEDFPNARFRVGKGALDVLRHGLGGVASHQHFDPETLPEGRTEKIDGEWEALGPFERVLDLFQDGSVYVVDLPGHLPGHVGLLCRIRVGEREKWVMLCGDAFHDRRLLTGEKEIGTWKGDGGCSLCIHFDKEVAAKSIERLRKFDEVTGEECELVAAHEELWWEKNEAKAFPKTL